MRYNPDGTFNGHTILVATGARRFADPTIQQFAELLRTRLFNAKTENAARKTEPSWYIVANQDRTVNPDLERFVTQRMGATTYQADSSHVPMLSQTGLVLDVIRAAAAGI